GTGLTQLGSIDTLSDVDTSTTPPVAGDYLRFDGTNWVTFTPNDLLQLQDSAGGQDFNTAAGTAVTWSLQTVLDSAFSHTAGTAAIGINRAGLYRITYSLSSDTNANTRRTCRGSIVVNGAESSASVSYGYGRNNTDDKLTAGASTLRQLNAGDTVEIFTQQAGSAGPSASIATESWVNIEFIRP
ncbi:MAG: hypothetical protein GY777_15905, partial [Candidatus Brocadiaceae bacterium]|nr:hypothetical protein [Candidatus Brocadiaceae bacterium]